MIRLPSPFPEGSGNSLPPSGEGPGMREKMAEKQWTGQQVSHHCAVILAVYPKIRPSYAENGSRIYLFVFFPLFWFPLGACYEIIHRTPKSPHRPCKGDFGVQRRAMLGCNHIRSYILANRPERRVSICQCFSGKTRPVVEGHCHLRLVCNIATSVVRSLPFACNGCFKSSS